MMPERITLDVYLLGTYPALLIEPRKALFQPVWRNWVQPGLNPDQILADEAWHMDNDGDVEWLFDQEGTITGWAAYDEGTFVASAKFDLPVCALPGDKLTLPDGSMKFRWPRNHVHVDVGFSSDELAIGEKRVIPFG